MTGGGVRARPPVRGRVPTALVWAGAAVVLVAVGLLVLAACGGGGGGDHAGGRPRLSVHGAYVPQPVTAEMAGGFLTVTNRGGTADWLTSVSTSLSDDVQIHRTAHQRMERVTSLPVPAGGRLVLGRGGNHLMLMDLTRRPVKGDRVSLTLHFAKSRPITVSAPVEATNYVPVHTTPGK